MEHISNNLHFNSDDLLHLQAPSCPHVSPMILHKQRNPSPVGMASKLARLKKENQYAIMTLSLYQNQI
jgi:hypothetical protein